MCLFLYLYKRRRVYLALLATKLDASVVKNVAGEENDDDDDDNLNVEDRRRRRLRSRRRLARFT